MDFLREQLQGMYASHGRLTSAIVVSEARDESHPLHSRFEWNDAVAGEQYRRVQAGEMIRSVKVVYKQHPNGGENSVRAFHVVPRPTGNSYVPIEEIGEDRFTTELVLREADRYWQTGFKRFGHLQEFLEAVRHDVAG